MPQYMIRMPHRANTNTQISNGTQPNQNFEENFHKIKNPNPFSKNPQIFRTQINFCIILHKHEENVLENIP